MAVHGCAPWRTMQRCGSARHSKMMFSAIAYISRTITPQLEITGDGDAVIFKGSSLRLIKRFAVVEQFYVTVKRRVDTVVVENKALETS